ncbi:MAG: signal peptidase II [Desulfobacterales bacterium]|nr:signal peptidase II [Desulfobacterales bacterium]
MNFTYSKYIKLICIAGLIIILDQITKLIILKNLPLYHSIPIIKDFFHFTHVQNPGGAFGFLSNENSTIRTIMFIGASSIAVIVILYLYNTTPEDKKFLSAGFALILGGAIGNLIDRIRFGYVIDFLDFSIKNIHWPAFNIADSAISIGIIIFAFHVLLGKIPE